ncbi:GSCOCG00001970001-RA-CDS, partial [Cotesia congregata]
MVGHISNNSIGTHNVNMTKRNVPRERNTPDENIYADEATTGQNPTDETKRIFELLRAGDTETVEELVEKNGLSILSVRDKWGYTPAHWAALDGNVE